MGHRSCFCIALTLYTTGSSALDDIREADLVRSLLMDIQDVRRSKIRRGLTALKDSAAVRLNNLTLMEINSIRPFFVQAMNTFYKMQEGERIDGYKPGEVYRRIGTFIAQRQG